MNEKNLIVDKAYYCWWYASCPVMYYTGEVIDSIQKPVINKTMKGFVFKRLCNDNVIIYEDELDGLTEI